MPAPAAPRAAAREARPHSHPSPETTLQPRLMTTPFHGPIEPLAPLRAVKSAQFGYSRRSLRKTAIAKAPSRYIVLTSTPGRVSTHPKNRD